MKLLKMVVALACVALVPHTASAQFPAPQQGVADIGPVQFLIGSVGSGDNTLAPPSPTLYGFVSDGAITGSFGNLGIYRFFCIDENAVIPMPPVSPEVWITRLDATDWSRTKLGAALGGAVAASRYAAAAGYAGAITTGDDPFNQNQQRNMWRATSGVSAINSPTTATFDPTQWFVISGRNQFEGQQELIAVAVVPEPATYGMIAVGLAALAAISRRRILRT